MAAAAPAAPPAAAPLAVVAVAVGTVFIGEVSSPPNVDPAEAWECKNKFTITDCTLIQLPADDPVAHILGAAYVPPAVRPPPAYRFEGIMESSLNGVDLGAIRCPGELVVTEEEGVYRFNVLGGARVRGELMLCPCRYVGEMRQNAEGKLVMLGSWSDPLHPEYTGSLKLVAE